jgi:HNH endonuclease
MGCDLVMLKSIRNSYHQRHQKYLDTPAYKEIRYNRIRSRENALYKHRDHKRPSKTERATFTTEEKQKVISVYGTACFLCESAHYEEIHHVKFKSKKGRGTFRNGVPVCKVCHDLIHEDTPQSQRLAHYIRLTVKSLYGEYYYMDVWDLYKLKLISSPTEELFERFMLNQEQLQSTKVI